MATERLRVTVNRRPRSPSVSIQFEKRGCPKHGTNLAFLAERTEMNSNMGFLCTAVKSKVSERNSSLGVGRSPYWNPVDGKNATKVDTISENYPLVNFLGMAIFMKQMKISLEARHFPLISTSVREHNRYFIRCPVISPWNFGVFQLGKKSSCACTATELK